MAFQAARVRPNSASVQKASLPAVLATRSTAKQNAGQAGEDHSYHVHFVTLIRHFETAS